MTNPPLLILPDVNDLLREYVAACSDEVSGLGEIQETDAGLLVTSVCLLPQECSPTETTLDPAGLAAHLAGYIRDGRDPAALRLWWHSHADMQVFWSGTDECTARNLGGGSTPWFVSVVTNHAGETLARLDLWSPLACTIALDLVEYRPVPQVVRDAARAEVAEKVRKAAPTILRGKLARDCLPLRAASAQTVGGLPDWLAEDEWEAWDADPFHAPTDPGPDELRELLLSEDNDDPFADDSASARKRFMRGRRTDD